MEKLARFSMLINTSDKTDGVSFGDYTLNLSAFCKTGRKFLYTFSTFTLLNFLNKKSLFEHLKNNRIEIIYIQAANIRLYPSQENSIYQTLYVSYYKYVCDFNLDNISYLLIDVPTYLFVDFLKINKDE